MPITNATAICLHCGEAFPTLQAEINRGNAKYCSKRCQFDGRPQKTVEQHFWPKVNKTDGCWLWTGAPNRGGYGPMMIGGRKGYKALAHRVSWELANGPIPSDMFVLHNCPGGDNPACVNPAHLWLGTRADNQRDMAEKNRSLYGERSLKAKITSDQASAIRVRYSQGGISQKALGKEFGISQAGISMIVTEKNWKRA